MGTRRPDMTRNIASVNIYYSVQNLVATTRALSSPEGELQIPDFQDQVRVKIKAEGRNQFSVLLSFELAVSGVWCLVCL